MTTEEKIKFLLRKFPELKYDRAEFFWKYIMICVLEFDDIPYITKAQFKEFWKEFATTERKLRDILKEPEFKLKPQQDSKRYEKAAAFKKEHIPIIGKIVDDKKLGNKIIFKDKKEQQDFNKAFK